MRQLLFVVLTTLLPVSSLLAQASATPFGSGCPGSNGTPVLSAGQGPALGQSVTLDMTNLPLSGGFVWLMWSTDSDNWAGNALPLDLGFVGAPGCMLNVRPDYNDFELQGAPVLSLTYYIPSNLTFLIGCRLLCQGMVCDGPANPLGYTSTNALELLFGS
ncbi:MAG: hypothetical protein VYE77_11310 [Planctomycetota bacterium]|nr:hypothetical protein [Planctomycetota bacterium]